MKLRCCVVLHQSKTPRWTEKSRERSSATEHLQIYLRNLIESWMTRCGCTPTRIINFLSRLLNLSTAKRDPEGGILFSVSYLIRRIPEHCVLCVQLKAHTQKIMQNLTWIIGCTLVKYGEHALLTTLVMALIYIDFLFLVQSLSLCPAARSGPP